MRIRENDDMLPLLFVIFLLGAIVGAMIGYEIASEAREAAPGVVRVEEVELG